MCMGEKDIQFFVDKRKIRDGELDHMTGSDQELRHAKEVFELMKALTHDDYPVRKPRPDKVVRG